MSHRESTPVDSVATELILAVGLTDRYTDRAPRGKPTVTLANAPYKFRRTPSGYHVLVDAPTDLPEFEIVVESTYYLDERRTVQLSSLDPAEPLETLDLVPGPAYPFGGGATLVRGRVTDGGDPVADATVAFVQGSDETRTNADGEFALPIEDIGREDIAREAVGGTNGGDWGGSGSGGGPGNGGPGGSGPGSGGPGGGGPGSGGSGSDSTTDDLDSDGTDRGGRRVIEPDGETPRVEAANPVDGRTTEVAVTVPVGGTASADLTF